ncbi:SpoIIE family protein phosphatase [Micromonospora zamorensis]
MLVRDGDTWAVPLPGNFPLGMFAEAAYRAGEVTLRPGDRLVVVTDGVRERNAASLDLPAILRSIVGLHPRGRGRPIAVLNLYGHDLKTMTALTELVAFSVLHEDVTEDWPYRSWRSPSRPPHTLRQSGGRDSSI